MKKIISLFKRNYDGDHLVRDEVVPGAEWVINGEGIATEKIDGTACMIRDGILYKRYDAKKNKLPPDGFIPAQDPDPVTGHWPGWLRVGDSPDDKWHREVWEYSGQNLYDGTYELVGPKVQGNPYKNESHRLIRHGEKEIIAPRTFAELRHWLGENVIEGIVWHHPDGRMVKIKRKDFGYKWPV